MGNKRQINEDAGKVSHQKAIDKAKFEYEKYRETD